MDPFLVMQNAVSVRLTDIPVLNYETFLEQNLDLTRNEKVHCVQYFGVPRGDTIRLFCCLGHDEENTLRVSSAEVHSNGRCYPSFTARNFAFHAFEREIHEITGLSFSDHPWLKPLRYPFDRHNPASSPYNYPFYQAASEELHEVGVGPIHAGIIEPGHFRFTCNGEQIMNLEIQLGYQHRGIESLFLTRKSLLQRNILAESIAGDAAIEHATAFANCWESLCGFSPGDDIRDARIVAAELERIAIHTGDLSAICTDVAYQLGSSVFGRLRTPVINTFQQWCGNRLAKGMIRAGRNPYPLDTVIRDTLFRLFDSYEPHFGEMVDRMKSLPSILARLERTGTVTREQAQVLGTVGMPARASGLMRDIRSSHPYLAYVRIPHQPIVKESGDVFARTQIRYLEISQSIRTIRTLLEHIPQTITPADGLTHPKPDAFAVSLTEGWRGEICHCAITGEDGNLLAYKIKDPSVHNWMALALAVRNNEISDFPITNKSFNLSYCGHDL